MGVLHAITTIITNNLNINMQSLNIGSNDGVFEGKIKALVYDTAHLDQLISSIKKVDGINEVKRTS